MLTVAEIKKQLEDMNIQAVSRASGISANTIYRFMYKNAKPLHETVVKLSAYLEGR